VQSHFGTRRNQAARWQQGGDEGKQDPNARRSSRAQRRMDRAEAKCAPTLCHVHDMVLVLFLGHWKCMHLL